MPESFGDSPTVISPLAQDETAESLIESALEIGADFGGAVLVAHEEAEDFLDRIDLTAEVGMMRLHQLQRHDRPRYYHVRY